MTMTGDGDDGAGRDALGRERGDHGHHLGAVWQHLQLQVVQEAELRLRLLAVGDAADRAVEAEAVAVRGRVGL